MRPVRRLPRRGQRPRLRGGLPFAGARLGPIDELRKEHGDVAGIAPLPDPTFTEPRLTIKPHKDAKRWDATDAGEIMNPEEV